MKNPTHINLLCDLCGLPVYSNAFDQIISEKTYHFCCTGCRQVFNILMAAEGSNDPDKFKESDVFKRSREMGIIPAPDSQTDLDGQQTESQNISSSHDTTLPISLNVSGMWCPACAWLVGEVIGKIPGVSEASCDFSIDRAWFRYDPVRTSPAEVINKINSLGYNAYKSDKEARPLRSILIRFSLCAILTLNVMMLSFALYSGFFTELLSGSILKLSLPIFGLSTVVVIYGGWYIFKTAMHGIKSGFMGMEILVSVGTLSAYIYSVTQMFSGSIHLYFDTAAMLITLVLLGKLFEGFAKKDITAALKTLFSLLPGKVKIVSDDYPDGRYVHVDALNKNDLFRVVRDDVVASDGEVVKGQAAVDESSITGESKPVTYKKGDFIKSGSTILRGDLTIKAHFSAGNSMLGQMVDIMQKTLSQKMPLEGKTDKILQWFVPVIIFLSLLTGSFLYFSGTALEASIMRAVTVMVISCPCALGIAIPLARVGGVALAGRKGLLIRDFGVFEATTRVDTIVFDKTGTITEGKWQLLDIQALGEYQKEEILFIAAALEEDVDHFIATEILNHASSNQFNIPISNKKIYDNGVSGTYKNQPVCIGSREFVLNQGNTITVNDGPDFQKQKNSLQSRVYLSCGGKLEAVFLFGDRLKESVSLLINKLYRLGYKTAVISGDDEKAVTKIAEITGIQSFQGGMTPVEKSTFINKLQENHHVVMMVGDGINDAPALALADVSVAVHTGSRLGKEAADITFLKSDPAQLIELIDLSGTVTRKVQQNFRGSFAYNLLSIPIAMSGLLTPLIAVCAMLISSLSVILNTLWMIKKPLKTESGANLKQD
ncbi:MAG: heavy metal translocating P-type ATPase [Desulfobacterales bacterium]|nr:heavy metal translocating P-type ATPase [Desulfobacterales bacterium]